jgi:hypothetical protein
MIAAATRGGTHAPKRRGEECAVALQAGVGWEGPQGG